MGPGGGTGDGEAEAGAAGVADARLLNPRGRPEHGGELILGYTGPESRIAISSRPSPASTVTRAEPGRAGVTDR